MTVKKPSVTNSSESDRLDHIKRRVVVGIFSDDSLMERLVLKGGNAIDLVLNVGTRASVDIDLSMEDDFTNEEREHVRQKLERRLQEAFNPDKLHVFDVTFEEKPKPISPEVASFWGGYDIAFKLIENDAYKQSAGDISAPPANEVDSSNQQPASQVDVQQQLAQQKLLQQKRLAEAQAQAKAEAQAKILQAQVDTLVSDYNTQRTLVKEFFVQAQADLIENTNLIIANRIFTRSKYLNENDQFFQQLSVLAKEQVKIYQAAKAAIDEFKATPGASYQDYKTRLDTIYSDLKKKRDAFAEQLADFRKRILK